MFPDNLAGTDVIELGCGTAYVSSWLARRGARVVGIDDSEQQLATARHLQREHGWARFVSMQDHYNLLTREEEREMIPLCLDEGVGTIVWSPLARGRLARAWTDAKSTARSSTARSYAPQEQDCNPDFILCQNPSPATAPLALKRAIRAS